LYMRDPVAKRVRPVKELKDFTKITLQAGEEKRVSFKLNLEKLSYYNEEGILQIEPGLIEIFAGGNSRDVLKVKFELK